MIIKKWSVLSNEEMKFLGYPADADNKTNKINNTVSIWALDCEAVITTNGSEVASIGFGRMVENKWETRIIMVLPKGEIIDYVTPITGFDQLTIFDHTFEEAINILLQYIGKNDIIVGHHLYQDLKLLNLYHKKVIDCSMIFHHPDGPPYYYSLKDLAKNYLKRIIQNNAHDPIEDMIASYDLVKWSADNEYIKTRWRYIGEKFTPTLDLLVDALQIPLHLIKCCYTRGSRAIGTNRPDSDYDLIVVCNKGANLIDGTLTRYGNVDICGYDEKYFENMLKDQIVWAVEAIYCPSQMIYIEQVNYRTFYEDYRSTNRLSSNQLLRKSVGYESTRKIASAKKHYNNGDYQHAKKHVFIAIRFIEYGRQITLFDRIQNIRGANHIWDFIKTLPTPLDQPNDQSNDQPNNQSNDQPNNELNTYHQFEQLWKPILIEISREFSRLLPQKQSQNRNLDDMPCHDNISCRNEDVYNMMNQLLDHRVLHTQNIKQFPSKSHPNLVLFKYTNQTPDNLFKYICRGIIFNQMTKKVVCYPFNNFISQYDPRDIRHITEKLDGSTAVLYWNDVNELENNLENKWNLSTSRNPDGNSILGSRKQKEIQFDKLFWKIFEMKKYDLKKMNPQYTYIFELVSKDHPIIIQYEEDDLVLIGVRNILTFEEVDVMKEEFNIFTRPKIYQNVEQIKDLNPNHHEGFVICLNNFNRIKIKKSEYVKKSLMFPLCTRNKIMDIHILKIIQQSAQEEFCKYCPEYADLLEKVNTMYNEFIVKIHKIDNDIVRPIDRRDYAQLIQSHDRLYHKYLFTLYDGLDLRIMMRGLNIKRLYGDMIKKPINRTVNKFNPTTENKYGIYGEMVKKWELEQIECGRKIITTDVIHVNNVRLVGGLDISFDPTNDLVGCAYLTIYDVIDQQIVYEDWEKCELTIPYISGFLGFREIPQYIGLLDRLNKTKPELYPQILMLDGFGILHHRGFGSASHIGYLTGIPSIGVAKTLLYHDGLDEHMVKSEFREKCLVKSDFINLVGISGKTWGVAYKSTNDSINPIYVTIGHMISLESCVKIVELTTKYRIPEPIRNSDIRSKIFLK
jgi:deoxyinosine 3'endonuclease (endonuclease V)